MSHMRVVGSMMTCLMSSGFIPSMVNEYVGFTQGQSSRTVISGIINESVVKNKVEPIITYSKNKKITAA